MTSPRSPGTPSSFDMRNDRSERLWGSDGQKRLAEAHIVLLGASAVGCEILKNVVLPGLGRFTIVDNAKVTKRDLGKNFFVTESSLGTSLAKAACDTIKELNPFVEGHHFETSIDTFVHSGGNGFLYGDVPRELKESEDPRSRKDGFHRPPFNATMVIASEKLSLPSLLHLSQALAIRNVPVFNVRCNGLLAYMRITSPDMPVVDVAPGPDDVYFDPRIVTPFPELKAFYEELDPTDSSIESTAWAHIPWMAILYHALKKWRAINNITDETHLPKMLNTEFKQKIKDIIFDFATLRKKDEDTSEAPEWFTESTANMVKALAFRYVGIPSNIKKVFEECAHRAGPKGSAFWVFAHATKSFVDEKGYLPLAPSLPDFTCTTAWYSRLAKIFKTHHQHEAEDIFFRATAFLKNEKKMGADEISRKIHLEACKNVCANSTRWQFVHYPSFEDEVGSDFAREFQFPESASDAASPDADHMRWKVTINEGGSSSSDNAAGWYTAIRASWCFSLKHGGKVPGAVATVEELSDEPNAAEEAELVAFAKKMTGTGEAPKHVVEQIQELVRYGGSEIGHIASIMGALVSQELIKFIQHKRVPVQPWVIYDGNIGKFSQIGSAQF